jgi:hypothetical protein
MADMADFSEFKFTYEDETRPVYVQGNGPAVVLLHELPGMIPQCVDLARSIAREGFTVFLPLLFGQPNQPFDLPPTVGEIAQTLGGVYRPALYQSRILLLCETADQPDYRVAESLVSGSVCPLRSAGSGSDWNVFDRRLCFALNGG